MKKENPRVRNVVDGYCSSDKTERYSYQCPVVMRYLENVLKGWSISRFFENIAAEKIVLYSVTEFTEYVAMDVLKNEAGKSEIVFVSDRNPGAYPLGLHGIPVVGIAELTEAYFAGKVDKILICNLFHSDRIFEDLMQRGILQEDLISIVSAVYAD